MTAADYQGLARVCRSMQWKSKARIAEAPVGLLVHDMTEDELRCALTWLSGYAPDATIKALEFAGGAR